MSSNSLNFAQFSYVTYSTTLKMEVKGCSKMLVPIVCHTPGHSGTYQISSLGCVTLQAAIMQCAIDQTSLCGSKNKQH